MDEKRERPQKTAKNVQESALRAKVPFLVWFDKQVKARKVRPVQLRELSVFFKEKGLSESEYSDKYSDTLKLY